MATINYDEMAQEIANKVLDEVIYNGRSLRKWMQIIVSGDCISRTETEKHLTKRLIESALENVDVNCDADEVFSDIAEYRLKTWLSEIKSY